MTLNNNNDYYINAELKCKGTKLAEKCNRIISVSKLNNVRLQKAAKSWVIIVSVHMVKEDDIDSDL